MHPAMASILASADARARSREVTVVNSPTKLLSLVAFVVAHGGCILIRTASMPT